MTATKPAPPLLFVHAAEVAACTGGCVETPDHDPAAVRRGAAVLVRDGRVAEIGDEAGLRAAHPDAELVDWWEDFALGDARFVFEIFSCPRG